MLFRSEYDMDKSNVKELFLTIMNGGSRDGITNSFFLKFKDECKRIHTFINSLNPDLFKEVKKRKEFNIEGSITNIILCETENLILLTAVQYLLANGYNVDVLVFDGLMIRKDFEGMEKILTEELFENLSNYVFEKTGYKVEFVEKELDKSINLDNYDDVEDNIEASVSYYKDKEEFERTHLKIIHPPLYCSCNKNKHELQSKESDIQSYEHIESYMKTENKGKTDISKEIGRAHV